MSSPQGAVRSKTPFPFVGLAVAVLLVHAILVALLPENPYRAAVALVALLAVGYCALALVAGRDLELSALEILAFSVVLTILITALSAIGVSLLGIPITVFAVVIVGLPMALLAWILRRPRLRSLLAVGEFARGLFDFSDYSRVEKGAAAVLLVAIAASLGVLLSLTRSPPGSPSRGRMGKRGVSHTELRLARPKPSSFPRSAVRPVALSWCESGSSPKMRPGTRPSTPSHRPRRS